jgi:CO/xanthine dehydrogenase FAD-binding subunit
VSGSSSEERALQIPAPFGYERATSVEHVIALLEAHGPQARSKDYKRHVVGVLTERVLRRAGERAREM